MIYWLEELEEEGKTADSNLRNSADQRQVREGIQDIGGWDR
jgi:hypothetical protein